MTSSAVKFWLVLAASLVAIYGSFLAARRLGSHNEAVVGPALPDTTSRSQTPKRPPMTEFTLTDQAGQPFNSQSLRGKVWVASFFFTNCPAVCWRLNQALAALQQTDPNSDVRYVSITCDPENDTPEALTKYAQHFQADPARWTFLTGEMELIQRIGQDFFQLSVEKAAHTDRACVVDRKGRIRGRFRLTEPDQLELLKRLLSAVDAEPVEETSGDASRASKSPEETAQSAARR